MSRITLIGLITLIIAAEMPVAAEPLSQTGWVNTYPSCGSCEGGSIAPATDGGYLVAGSIQRSPDLRDLLVLKTDAAGKEQWTATGNGNACRGTAIVPAGPGRSAVAGDSCAGGSGSTSLTLVDETKGTFFSVNEYDTGRGATKTALLRTGDGGYLMLADADTGAEGRTDRDVLIHRVRSDGTVAWSREFAGRFDDTGASAVETAGGNFVVALTTGTGDDRGTDIVLFGLDSSGNQQWIAAVGQDGDEQAAGIVSTGNGYLVAGTACDRNRQDTCDFYAAETDPEGRVLWDNRYGGTGREKAAAVLPAPGGGYLIAGSTDSSNLGADGRDIRLVQVDGNGSEVWNSTFGSAAYEYVTGAAIAPDTSLVLTGYLTDPVDTGTHTLFLLNAGTGGRYPPQDVIRNRTPGVAGSTMRVTVRDAQTGDGIAGASVYLDGKLTGKTSAKGGDLSLETSGTQTHSLRVAKEGYREQTVLATGRDEITVSLRPSAIHRLAGSGQTATSLDIVFVPSATSYNCTGRQVVADPAYTGSPDLFLADIRRLVTNRLLALGQYTTVPGQLPAGYPGQLNIYYYWDGYTFADAFDGCAGTLPEGFYDEAPYTDVAVILYPEYSGTDTTGTCEPLGCTSGPGPGPQVYFKVAADHGTVFLHESGHAMFGLMDTYCGTTYYEENQPAANIWGSEAGCIADAQKNGWDAALCRPIDESYADGKTVCDSGFSRYDADPDLMSSTGLTAKFGEAATRRIRYVLDTIQGGR